MTYTLENSIDLMVKNITEILTDNTPSIYLYGSYVLNDFKLSWSDIDILVLTNHSIKPVQAEKLLTLRQSLLSLYPSNPYYRSFEGGMLSLQAFQTKIPDCVVYWGTSGQRITDTYYFDSFCMAELKEKGTLLYGKDVRETLNMPSYSELKNDIFLYYQTIRKYAQTTDRSLYSYGWLLDISRCLYTLQTGKIISKTVAAEWALQEHLCPDASALRKALEIRKKPMDYIKDSSIFDYAETLGESIQRYADVLEFQLNKI